MEYVIVTGMSGAGRSTAMKMLEDMGFFCVDNLPLYLLEKLIELSDAGKKENKRVAVGVDIRSGGFESFPETIQKLNERKISYRILYLDADDSVLIKRYKETRRNHPLAKDRRLDQGIVQEREILEPVKAAATYIVDTSRLLTRELKAELEKIFLEDGNYRNLYVTILSFGFKYGIPRDSDLVFDVRFLPNPYYVEGMRNLTGNDPAVSDFVMGHEDSRAFLDKLEDMVSFLIPRYISEGKSQLVISVGCTGGKHRSVTMANGLYERLSEYARREGYGLKVEHRDLDRDAKRGPANRLG